MGGGGKKVGLKVSLWKGKRSAKDPHVRNFSRVEQHKNKLKKHVDQTEEGRTGEGKPSKKGKPQKRQRRKRP